jgi:hypothetical protein
MRRNPDTEDSDVDGRDENDSSPLDSLDSLAVFSDECDSVDDDLHKQLNFENPEGKNEEQDGHTSLMSASIDIRTCWSGLPGTQRAC